MQRLYEMAVIQPVFMLMMMNLASALTTHVPRRMAHAYKTFPIVEANYVMRKLLQVQVCHRS